MKITEFKLLAGEQRQDEFAARIIVETNSDYRLLLNDDGSADGLVDYLIVERGSHVGVLEVGRNTDPASKANYAAWASAATNPPVSPDLAWWWWISCNESFKYKGFQKRIVPILRDMESAGVQLANRLSLDSWRPDSFAGRLIARGVVSARVVELGRNPGRIDVTSSGSSIAAAGVQALVDEHVRWLGSEAPDQAGLRRKLSVHSQLPHRQAFVWVDAQSALVAWHALGEDLAETLDPPLPNPLTGIWIASSTEGWGWATDKGWFKLEHIATAVSHARTLLP